MNNSVNNDKNNLSQQNKQVADERFEQNAGVKIHKGKESYGGGSGFYAAKAKPNCPNMNDEHDKRHSNDNSK